MRSALLTLLPLACSRPTAPAGPAPGTISVQWTGSQSGSFTAPGQAAWCARDSMVEVLATRGDTGVGIALLAEGRVKPAQHPVLSPIVPVSWRPIGLAALRWVTPTQIMGFEGASGVVQVTDTAGGSVTGTLEVRMRTSANADTLSVRGTFTAVPIRPAIGDCGRMSKK